MFEIVEKQLINKLESSCDELIPIECYLNRVFPPSNYKSQCRDLIDGKIFQPRKDCEAYEISFPIAWEAEWCKEDRNWRMQLQGMVMFHPIMNFFDTYEYKRSVVDYFLEVICDWSSNYGDNPNDIVTTRMPVSYAWYDMSVGFRALVIAFFIDRISHFKIGLSSSEVSAISKIAFKHIAHLRNEKVFSLNNHGMFQIQGLMSLIQLLGVEDYEAEYEYALNKMEQLVFTQFDGKGIHLEHSPHYHFYALTTFDNAVRSGWYDSKETIPRIVSLAHGKKKWIVDPLNRPACIGDSILTEQKGISFDCFDEDNHTEIQKGGKRYVISDFNDSGYSIIRSEWSEPAAESTYLFFMGMYHSKVHKHRDCLSLEWFDDGEKILCDSGKYGYKSDKYRHYFLSNKAHNTVEIDGFDILKIKPYGSAILESSFQKEVFHIKGELNYPAIIYSRDVFLNPGKWLIVNDDLKFKRARDAIQWFHLNLDCELVSVKNNRLTFSRAGSKKLIVHCLSHEVECELHVGDEDNMQGFISQRDYSYDSSCAIGYKFFGDDKRLLTILALGDSSYQSAIDFVKHEKLIGLSDVEVDKDKFLIEGVTHKYFSDLECVSLDHGKGTYEVLSEDNSFDFYLDRKKSDRLVIMLPGATNRAKALKNFQRHSWTGDFDCSVLSFLDPTISEYNDLSIGWYQGTLDNYLIPKLQRVISALVEKIGVPEEKVLFFGSSAGGFTSLKLAEFFIRSTVVVINPQIYLNHYTRTHFERLLLYSYKGISERDVIRNYKERISVDVDLDKREAPIVYYQNTYDQKHDNKHLRPFLKKLEDASMGKLIDKSRSLEGLGIGNQKLYVVYYTDEQSAHSPPDRATTIKMIKDVFDI